MESYSRSQNFVLSELTPLPPHLKKALEDTGRNKLSSATPAPQSPSPSILAPVPNRRFHEQLDMMNKSNFTSDRVVGGSSRGSPSPQRSMGPPRRTPQDQIWGSSSNQGASSGPAVNRAVGSSSATSITLRDPGRNSSRNSINIESQTPNIARITKEFHTRVETLLNKIRASEEVSTGMQAALVEHVQSIAQEFNQQHRRLQDAFDRLTREKTNNGSELKKVQADLQAALADRDQALEERDSHQTTISELRLKSKNDAQKLEQVQSHWKEVNEKLNQRLVIQDEQLKGKRALWMDSNPGSSARRDAMNAIRDPFNSPTTVPTPAFDRSYMATSATGSPHRTSSAQSQYGPPPQFAASKSSLSSQLESFTLQPSSQLGLRRRPNMPPTQRLMPPIEFMESMIALSNENRTYNTEPPSVVGVDPPSPRLPSIRGDLAGLSDDALSDYYHAEFARLFSMTEGWAKIYCSQPNLVNDRQIASSGQELWQFMMNCAYPGQLQDSHTHVMALLNDARSRCWFVMRMIVAFCVKDILSLDIFQSFGAKQEVQLREVKTKLLVRGLNNEARQELIDRQVKIVEAIVADEGFIQWRNTTMNHASKRLRDMVGPLLNDSSDRNRAGKDLGAIGMFAWKLAIDLHTSHLTFQVYFPETAAKFNATTMIAKDQPRINPMELQIKQVRLKLVITPVVTLRDDRGTTIKAKSLHHSTVLIMG